MSQLKTFSVRVHQLSQSRPINRDGVVNAYTKDGLYCLLLLDGTVKKYPLCNIFEITEENQKGGE